MKDWFKRNYVGLGAGVIATVALFGGVKSCSKLKDCLQNDAKQDEKISTIIGAVSRNSESIAQTDSLLCVTAKAVNAHGKIISALEGDVDDLTDRVDSLANKMDSVIVRVDSLEQNACKCPKQQEKVAPAKKPVAVAKKKSVSAPVVAKAVKATVVPATDAGVVQIQGDGNSAVVIGNASSNNNVVINNVTEKKDTIVNVHVNYSSSIIHKRVRCR